MTEKAPKNQDFSKVWGGLADAINQLPDDEKSQFREVLGVFMHDMKHTLGLISNANELIRRDIRACPSQHQSVEMVEIINTGAGNLNAYIDIMVNDCVNLIESVED